MRPSGSTPSLGRRDRRIQSTSMDAPRSSTTSPARLRTTEWRPSAPTINVLRMVSKPAGVLARTPAMRPPFFEQVGDLGLHSQMEIRVALGVPGKKMEKSPLRHHGNDPTSGSWVCEAHEPHQLIADYARKTTRFLVRQFEELVEQAELADDLERRGMNGIAAEIAEKIRMLFKDHHLDTGARE